MKKVLLIIFLIVSLITFTSCKKKKTVVINLCVVDYNNIRDNYTGIDIIDEGCSFAKVDKWIIKCKQDELVKINIDVYDGFHIKECYYNDVYSLDNAKTLSFSNNSVELKALSDINYVIFDIIPNN
ncbi:MAG: hypothetical protein K6E87_01080 [bacterium]|nr:hypothetical protein [bacterium]